MGKTERWVTERKREVKVRKEGDEGEEEDKGGVGRESSRGEESRKGR